MLALFASAIFLICFSCDIHKIAQKSKSDTDFKENIETKTFRKGDTVHYEIPKVIYRDTTIYRTNHQGTTIKTVYDQNGQMQSIDCFASAIEEFRKENRAFQQSLKDKAIDKTSKFDSSWIIYLVAGIVFMFLILIFFLYKFFDKKTKLLEAAISKVL